jgi:octopine/nopaline transport system ATP-binding protein
MTVPVLPLTYDECRARFRQVASSSGLVVRPDEIRARGPDGQRLTVDSVRFGSARPSRVLVVLGGVHGVEGFIASAVQCEFVERLSDLQLPADLAVVVVHGVNPWGMAWWRRQNESNVDLNRNWRRDAVPPPQNPAYDELHPIACPDGDEVPSVDRLMASAGEWVEARGLEWVRDGITRGQFGHPDGLHYGGERTEESNLIVESLVADLVGVDDALVVDLHTGHGPWGEVTLLSDQPPGSAQDDFFAAHFDGFAVEATVDNPGATTGAKYGQIANGIRDLLGPDRCWSTCAEFGTTSDLEQLAATYQESWVHRHGNLADPRHAEVVWQYRCCFTPDDARWVDTCRRRGAELLDTALAALSGVDADG